MNPDDTSGLESITDAEIESPLFSRVVELLRRQEAEEPSSEHKRQLEAMFSELEQFYVEHPSSVPALRLLSECAQRLGDFGSARRYISLAELLDPWNLELLIISESLYELESHQPRRGFEPVRFRFEISRGVITSETLQEKAMGLFRLGELERAYSLAKLSYCISPQIAHLLMDVLAAGSAFDPERTRREMMRLEEAGHATAYLFLVLGSINNVLGIYEEAVAWLTRGIELRPEDPYVLSMLYNELAYVMAKQEIHLDRCIVLARNALDLFPDRTANGFIRDTLGVAYLKAGDFDKAVKNLREAVSKDPTVIPRFHLALALLNNRDASNALGELKQIAASRPSLESPHVEEIAILDRVQSHISKLENLLNLGGADDIRDALGILEGLV